jgi:Acetyltransferases
MIRSAISEDASRIVEINVCGWRYAYRGIVSDEILFGKMDIGKRIEPMRKTIEDLKNGIFVNDDDGIINGFMTIGKCRDEDAKNEYEIWAIYVEPLMIKQGIGTKLLKYAESIAIENKYNGINLWVLEKNELAKKFYERNGYSYDGNRKELEKYKAIEIRYHKQI